MLNLVFVVADVEAVAVAVVVALVLAVCFAFGAGWIIAQGESIRRPRGRIHAQGASIIRRAFCWCNSRFSNPDFGVIPCILEHGASA